MKKKIAFLILLTFIVYAPLLNKNFNSDDFSILRRVVLSEHGILIKGFFRILADATFYVTYLLFDFKPFAYTFINVLLHGIVVGLTFKIAYSFEGISNNNREKFAWLTALLFLFYPFHNESVLWIVGRASLLATLLGLIIFIIAQSGLDMRWKYLLTSILYFIALSAYESVFLIPIILFVVTYKRSEKIKKYIWWMTWLGLAFVIHLILRYSISNAIVGEYGSSMFSSSFVIYILKCFKSSGRLFVPPFEHSNWFIFSFLLIIVAFSIYTFYVWKRRNENLFRFKTYFKIWFCLLCSMVVPIMFGVNTHTFEGDRLFYFPSFFLALLIALIIVNIQSAFFRKVIAAFTFIYFVVFFYINLYCWIKADKIINNTITTVSNIYKNSSRKIAVVNLPQEYEGIFVFRNGFSDALLLNNLDTSRIKIINFVTTEELRKCSKQIEPVFGKNTISIAPGVVLRIQSEKGNNDIRDLDTAKTTIIYWNKVNWKIL